MTGDVPHLLLVNPWIHDFAAYDVWARPLGLLTLAGILRTHGCRLGYIDCLDRFHTRARPLDPLARFGRGPYRKSPLPHPPGLGDVPRRFSRYGIPIPWFREALTAGPRPHLILVTSLMTYWYPGVREAIRIIREIHPGVPVILGGPYVTLCARHAAASSGADRVVAGEAEGKILEILGEATGFRPSAGFDSEDLDTFPYPALDLQSALPFVPLLTSRGCPFQCAYCASRRLNPHRRTRSPEGVLEEIRHWYHRFSVRDFVFYDDALLAAPEDHALPLLEGIVRMDLPLRFHTPNAVHVRGIDRSAADLLFRAGFKTLRLGLETTAFGRGDRLDRKVTAADFQRAARCLRSAGFSGREVGAYLLAGLPGQSISAVAASIEEVKAAGFRPIPAYYSPIPGTPLWDSAVSTSRYDLEKDPLFANNAVLPCMEAFSWEIITHLKTLAAGS